MGGESMLKEILETKKKEIEGLMLPEYRSFPRKSLRKSLLSPVHSLGLIAEIKRASPSKGMIAEHISPAEIAKVYESSGASAISVLTDEHYFKGNRAYIAEVKQVTTLPVLRKDFILSELQIEETARLGADALLLIAGTVEMEQLQALYNKAYKLGLECLVEVHSEMELKLLLSQFTPEIIGINNRNLNTFETSLAQTEQMAAFIPKGVVIVSESGIHHAQDIERVRKAGANAVLIGESLMRNEDKETAIRTLFSESVATE